MTSRQRTIGYRRLFDQRGGALYSRPAGRLPLSQPANGFRIIGCVWNSEVVRRLFRRDNELRPYASAGKTASKRVALQDKKNHLRVWRWTAYAAKRIIIIGQFE